MSQDQTSADRALHYNSAVDLGALQPRLLALAEQAATAAFSAPNMMEALAKGLDEAASLMRAVPIQEGQLLEEGIALLATTRPDLLVLTENIRLPVTPAALQLVALNDEQHFRRLTLDADTGGRKGYTPDILLVHQSKRLAYVVDVKRTLTSYESTRIADLKSRMLASALVVPDLLYKEHRRIAVDEVRVVIVNADGRKVDIDQGVWPLSHLDHLLELDGAGLAIEWLRLQFTTAVERNWKRALCQFAAVDRAQAPGFEGVIGGDASPFSKEGVGEDQGEAALPSAVDGNEAWVARHGPSQRSRSAPGLPPPLRVGLARVSKMAVTE